MKKYFLITSLVVNATIIHAQSTDTYLNNYVQPSPNAASLGKYVDFPVSYYTGVPEINIPIYELQDGAAKIPVSLSYHASGIKVSEVASSVGLGWALNAGGMVIRTVRGAPDEGTLKGTNSTYGPVGYYASYGLKKLPLLPYPINGEIPATPQNQVMNMYTVPGVNGGYYDTEPDLYFFNFNGYTGKFVFDENQNVRLLSDDNIKISVNYSGGNFNYWIFTVADGTKYYFGENGLEEYTNPSSTVSGSDVDAARPSAWYLSRIVYPNTKDTVYFNYSHEMSTYRDLGPETEYFGPGGYDLSWSCFYLNPINNLITTTVSGWRLSTIKSKNYTVSFIAQTGRNDLLYGLSNMLDTIKISTAAGQCLKQVALGHTYFTSTNATGINPSLLNYINDNTDTRRLKLASVTEYSGDLSISKPSYKFTYQESFQLPRRMSYDQDHWGFSNNSRGGSNNSCFTPGINSPLCAAQYANTGSNRNPKWPDMSAFTLISITDPLGVITNFQFEANSAGNTYPSGQIVGGLRIHQISTTDSITGITNYRLFKYSNGYLFKTPTYLFALNNEFYTNNGFTINSYRGYQNVTYITQMLKQSQSVVPLQDFQGNHIAYPEVTEIFGLNGEGGSKKYVYWLNSSPTNNSRLDMSNFTALQTIVVPGSGSQTGIYGNGQFYNILPQNLTYYQRYDVDNYYPAAPQQVELTNGKLFMEFTYDSSNALIKSVQNTYQEIYHEYLPIRGFKVYPTPKGNYNGSDIAMTFYKLHTGVSHLISSVETDYKDGKVMTTTHNYGYEDTLHTLQTSDTTVTSEGDSIIKKRYYSWDYANSATSDNVFAKMQSRNMLLPVSTRVWKNNKLLSGTITQYQDFASGSLDTFINPAKIFSLQTTSPLSPLQAGENIAFTNPFVSLIPNTSFIEKADFTISGTTGKIIQQKLVNDKNQSLIWDNGYSLPLAQVDNAYFSDVAYNSFESAEKGNWTFNSSSIVTDQTVPTGSHAYSLSSANPISKNNLNSSQTYIVSYWLKTGASASVSGGTQSGSVTGRVLNNWTYHEIKVTGASSISITGSGNIDEVRLYPSTAQMTTYTYDALMRLIAECSANSTISYYEYDALNRVTDIKDQYGNVLKTFQYNYGRNSRASQ